MAPIERARLVVRAGITSEGPNGLVMPQRILEWMQEAAAHSSKLAGYPPERYVELGASWFIKEILLAIDAPIVFGDEVAVETWVSDLRRFRSRREYRLTVGDRVVARAQADWMLLERNKETGKVWPRRPDEAMTAAFPRVAETALSTGDVPELEDLPRDEPDLGPDVRHVHPTEIDRHGHVNNTVYLRWLEDHARLRLGDGLELDRVRLEYLQDARSGDTISVSGWQLGAGHLEQVAVRDDRPVLRARARRVPAATLHGVSR